MATGALSGVIPHFRRAALLHDGGGMSDGQLLERFLAGRELGDEAAFEALIRRHGPMVLGVCRRTLKNPHDADDAFQATFLVLVRKAASLLPRAVIGNWLYGVAYHTALKARAVAAKRRAKEAQVREMSRATPLATDRGNDWQPLLDRELSRLPHKFREPIVLCDLEGKTRREAARQLGIPEGTLSGRLTTARRRLARRLRGHGFALSGGAIAVALSQNVASACVPTPLVLSTTKAAALLAAGVSAAGVISATVAALTEGVVKAMLVTKLKVTAAFVIAIGLLAVGCGLLVNAALGAATVTPAERNQISDQARAPKEQPAAGTTVAGKLEAADADKSTVTVSTFTRATGVSTDKTLPVAKDATIVQDGKKAKLEELKKGARATLTLSPDQKTVVSISVAGNTTQAPLKAVDAEKSTVTITAETRQGKVDRTFQVAKDAKVTLDGKQAKLADVKAGTIVVMTFSAAEANTVIQIRTPTRRDREENE